MHHWPSPLLFFFFCLNQGLRVLLYLPPKHCHGHSLCGEPTQPSRNHLLFQVNLIKPIFCQLLGSELGSSIKGKASFCRPGLKPASSLEQCQPRCWRTFANDARSISLFGFISRRSKSASLPGCFLPGPVEQLTLGQCQHLPSRHNTQHTQQQEE